jgi:exonuclease VII large subunit
MLTWLKDNGSRIAALAAVFTAFITALHLFVANPVHKRFDDLRTDMNQRFDDMNQSVDQRFLGLEKRMEQGFAHAAKEREQNFAHLSQRFDDQDDRLDRLVHLSQRLDRLTEEVSELRQLTVGVVERVSRNEGRIQAVQEQLQIADAP